MPRSRFTVHYLVPTAPRALLASAPSGPLARSAGSAFWLRTGEVSSFGSGRKGTGSSPGWEQGELCEG